MIAIVQIVILILVDGGHMVAFSHPASLADRLEAYRLEVQSEERDAGR